MSSFDNIKPPKLKEKFGSLHPINEVKDFLIDLLKSFGFNQVDGPEI